MVRASRALGSSSSAVWMFGSALSLALPEGTALAANVVAQRFSPAASASPHWCGDDPTAVAGVYDLVMPLANERGVRAAIQGRQSTVLLSATTGNDWQAQLHRHVAGVDDCTICRIPPDTPQLSCSTSTVEAAGREVDATLPFLFGGGRSHARRRRRASLGWRDPPRPVRLSCSSKSSSSRAGPGAARGWTGTRAWRWMAGRVRSNRTARSPSKPRVAPAIAENGPARDPVVGTDPYGGPRTGTPQRTGSIRRTSRPEGPFHISPPGT